MLGFVPQMLVLFLFLAFLEACGYMARVAFIMDRIFRSPKSALTANLHTQSSPTSLRVTLGYLEFPAQTNPNYLQIHHHWPSQFIPMLIGTGCGVPGIMASRTIENDRDRKMTIMTTTFTLGYLEFPAQTNPNYLQIHHHWPSQSQSLRPLKRCEVVEISALKGTGIMQAAKKAAALAKGSAHAPVHRFAPELEEAIISVEGKLGMEVLERQKRFFAIKLLERSIILTAISIGIPSSKSCVDRYRFRSIFVPSTIFKMTSGCSSSK